MKRIKRLAFFLTITCATIGLSSCEDDRTGEIVHRDVIEGKWVYSGMTMDVQTSFILATDSIEKDLAKKNKTSEFILELTSDKRYIISEYTVLQDSGRYELEYDSIQFTSKMLGKPIIGSTKHSLNRNDLTFTYDVKPIYTAECLDSLGIKQAEGVTVYQAYYKYLFKK